MMIILFACFTSYTFLRVRGQEGEYVHTVLCCCSCPLCGVRGAGANLNTVKRIVTLHWNQTNFIYITIYLKKVSIQMNLKIPCTSCSD